jgi:hypothetical protein
MQAIFADFNIPGDALFAVILENRRHPWVSTLKSSLS